jgi:hypothetical protein
MMVNAGARWSAHWDKGKQVDIGILDFSKAKQVPANPHLGLLIAEDLKWKEHINNTCKKVSSTIMIDPYSIIDLTRAIYAVLLHSLGQCCRFLLRNPSVELAFLQKL